MNSHSRFHSIAWPAGNPAETLPLWVDQNLEAFIEWALGESFAQNEALKCPPNLGESIRYSLLAPGKRIRPRLAIACGHLFQIAPHAALAAGAAIEMIHCFTLIHDDLPCMDNDDFRRGRPSNHKVYGEAMALLAGDALVACATDTLMIAEGAVPHAALLRAIRRLSWAAGPRGVIGGQAMEPLLSKTSTLSDLEKMFAGKTGALFAASLLLPLDLAGIDESTREGAVTARFARELGYAFQVADDLEDAEAPDSKEAEKPQSILYFLSSTEAATQTSARLSRSVDELRTLFGARASGLADIGGEVLKKLALRMKKTT